MRSFRELYEQMLREGTGSLPVGAFDPHHLDCLLNPDRYPPVWRIGHCDCGHEQHAPCEQACLFDALKRDAQGNIAVQNETCTGCLACVERCAQGKLTASRDIMPVLRRLVQGEQPVYALIAPAFIGQFSRDVTPGRLRAAFKSIGFAGMIEVALFADILTLKEAFEFDHHIHTDNDFMLASCCCPIWIAMIRKLYNQLVGYIPPSVSPMVACGRAIKRLYPDAATVFIGPCIAKKAESRERDIADAIDHVLTFQEVADLFEAADIHPERFEEDLRENSSTAGRIYARTGGVSQAVQDTLNRVNPGREVPLHALQADGAAACKELLAKIAQGDITANYLEGMGCVGGCVGGPKRMASVEHGTQMADLYAEQAAFATPVDNPYVLELLRRLGFETIEELTASDSFLTRTF